MSHEAIECFVDEVRDELPKIRRAFAIIHACPDDRATLEEVHRLTHSIQGTAALVGVTALSGIAQHQEFLLEQLLDGRLRMNDRLRDTLERLTDIVESFANGLLVGNVQEQRLQDDAARIFQQQVSADSAPTIAAASTIEGPLPIETSHTDSELVISVAAAPNVAEVIVSVKSGTERPTKKSVSATKSKKNSSAKKVTRIGRSVTSSVMPTVENAPVEIVEPVISLLPVDVPTATFAQETLEVTIASQPPQSFASDKPNVTAFESVEERFEQFLKDAVEHLYAMGLLLDGYRRDLTRWDSLADVRRRLHSLRGAASEIGFDDFAHLALHAQDLLQRLLDRTVPPTENSADCLQACVDALEERLNGPLDSGILTMLHDRLDELTGGRPVPSWSVPDSLPIQTQEISEPLKADVEQPSFDASLTPSAETQFVATPVPPQASEVMQAFGVLGADIELDDRSKLSEEMLEVFNEEADDHLRKIYAAFSGLELNPGQMNLIQDVRRSAHTIKGAAGSVGLRLVSKLSHRMEDVLDQLFESQQPIESPTLALLYSTTDALHDLVKGNTDPQEMISTVSQLYHQYDFVLADTGDRPARAEPLAEDAQWTLTNNDAGERGGVSPPVDSSLDQEADAAPVDSSQDREADIAPVDSLQDRGVDATPLADEVCFVDPPSVAIVDSIPLPPSVASNTAVEPTTSEEVPVTNELVLKDTLPMLAAWNRLPEPVAERPEGEVAARTSKTNGESLRVPIDRIDSLVREVGELIINRTAFEQRMLDFGRCVEEIQRAAERLRQASNELDSKYSVSALGGRQRLWGDGASLIPNGRRFSNRADDEFDALEFDRYTEFHLLSRSLAETTNDIGTVSHELRNLMGDFDQLLNRQGRLSRDTQDRLMRIRMVPLATIATRLHRTARVVAAQRGKSVEFLIQGGDIELDKLVLDELADPLMHLLRNAVDHGVESSDKRLSLGKSAQATILVQAFYQGTQVVIRVGDDGTGLDFEAIRETAVRQRLADAADVVDMDETQLASFIFLPGFSTARELSEVSGRGVGMDIVRDRVQKLKGTISVESKPGQGATFTIRLPMTLAVTRALLLEAAGETFAMPIQAVAQILRLDRKEVEPLGQSPIVRLGDEPLPLIYLADRLKLSQAIDKSTATIPVLVLVSGEHKIALAVDRILSARDIVVKTLGTHLRRVKGLIGATLMGDGSVVPILDATDLVDLPTVNTARPISSVSAPHRIAPADVKPTIMVVDDSVSVRRVMTNLLKAAGWTVLDAKDGVDALEKLRHTQQPPNLFLLDIEMPRMNGFELLGSLRSQKAHHDTPIVMVTSRAGDKHRQKALSLGATDYVVKPYQDDQLLTLIRQLLYANREPVLVIDENQHQPVLQ